MVMLLAGGVSVIVTNTQALGTILPATEQLVTGTWAGAFAVVARLVNIPLPFPDAVEFWPCRTGNTAAVVSSPNRGRPWSGRRP